MSISVTIHGGRPGSTYQVSTTNAAAALATNKMTQAVTGKLAESAVITVENNPIRYAFTSTPTQGGLGHKANPGDIIKLNSRKAITDFKHISDGSGNHAVLQVTPSFRSQT